MTTNLVGTKSAEVEVKSLETIDDGDKGIVECVVSVFGNVDSYGDVVVPGAFADSLKAYADAGNVIPFVWSHQSYDPDAFLGAVLEAKETDKGLWIKAQIDLDEPTGRRVFKLLKNRLVTQFSFAYEILDAGPVTVDGETYYELRKLHVFEVGPTMIGANRETELVGVKHAAQHITDRVKAGQTLNAKSEESLRTAYAALATLIAELDAKNDEPDAPQTTTDDVDEEPQTAKDEEPNEAKSKEPEQAKSSAVTREVTELEAVLLELDALA